jgi:cytochrome c-type biogenesis protein CcmH
MSVLFWIVAVAMLAISLWLVLPSFIRGRRKGAPERTEVNVAIYRERLAELERQRDEGAVDQDQYEQARAEAERALLADLREQPSGATAPPARGARRLAPIVVGVAVPALALGLYLGFGSEGAISAADDTGAAAAQGADTQHPPLDEFIAKLQAKVQAEPEDVQSWLTLGRAYAVMGRLDEAQTAYARAHRIAPDNPDVMVGLAEVMGRLNGNNLTGRPSALLDRALELDPDSPNGLWLGGFAAFQNGEPKRAIERWQRLRSRIDLNADEKKLVDDYMARARSALGARGTESAAASAAAGSSAVTPGASLRVRVSLAPELADQAQPTDSVFIFARARNGPPMPLAVVRKQVRDLPVTVVLDDSSAMVPSLKLSRFDTVVVGARVSKSGSATPAAGDLEGVSAPVHLPDGATVDVAIARVRAAGQTASAGASAAAAPAAPAAVRVRVSLAPELADQAQPTDSVFIFARASNGPPMPLAVVRKQVRDLPVTVVLDDSAAMAPSLKLSRFDSVVVGARVSKSGSPTPASGDLEGLTDAFDPRQQPDIDLSIARVLP